MWGNVTDDFIEKKMDGLTRDLNVLRLQGLPAREYIKSFAKAKGKEHLLRETKFKIATNPKLVPAREKEYFNAAKLSDNERMKLMKKKGRAWSRGYMRWEQGKNKK